MSAVLDFKRKVYAIRDLPTLPVIAQKVLLLADDDESSAEKLTAMISSDQSLSVKVLALANSAYYGYRAKIGTIRHAVIVIGTNMLKQLSLSVLVCGTMGKGGKDRTEFWRHSFGTATASSLIAKRTGISDGDVSFMAGLLHDIGQMVIDTHFPDEPGMEHTEVGAWMGERWQLPEPLINAIAFHHSLDEKHLEQPIVACVHAADVCSKLALTDEQIVIAPPVLAALKLTEDDFVELVEEVRNRKTQMDRLLI
ncbi:MAG TPA: HDOD domain-containing protein [Terriglobia bacterium]|nr:HDOD domain-containing protein [Terriglobia bacterium]